MSSMKTCPSAQAVIGVMGGSGLYEMEGLDHIREVELETPFGKPSDPYILGEIAGRPVAFLSRHGRGHRLLPSEINYRANICGFKILGVRKIVSVNSVGSLREDYRPRDIVVADQFFDRSKRRSTFFGEGLVAHAGLGEPVCPVLSSFLYEKAVQAGVNVHPKGTYLCMEGPGFSTRAESLAYRTWGADIIGMTVGTEAKLAREAEICYAAMCLVTDYDVWRKEEEHVSVEMVIENLNRNIGNAKRILKDVLSGVPLDTVDACGCPEALRNTFITRPDAIPPETLTRLEPIVGRYFKKA